MVSLFRYIRKPTTKDNKPVQQKEIQTKINDAKKEIMMKLEDNKRSASDSRMGLGESSADKK